jgi:hypothetical protein
MIMSASKLKKHTRQLIISTLVIALGQMNPALAHHSMAMFDKSQELTIEGTVIEWHFANPHAWLQISAPHDGNQEVVWGLESSSTRFLITQGYRRTSMQPDDTVSVDYYPMRDGSPGGSIVRVRLADGTLLGPPSELLSSSNAVSSGPLEAVNVAYLLPLGALHPDNLSKPRPVAPFDLTGTWFIDSEWRFLPLPTFKADAQALKDLTQEYADKGIAYNNTTAKCWPPGVPIVMTRVWPIHMVQIETSIVMVSNFETQVRWIYMDGREHSDPDLYSFSYNGESLGHWEGDVLVIDTVHFEGKNHLIDGTPVSDQLHVVERIQLLNDGDRLLIEFTMTDPVNWEGQWVSTKEYRREERSDFIEVHCLPDSNTGMSGTSSEYNLDLPE